MNKLIITALSALAILASCNEKNTIESTSNIIKISTSINGLTRVADNQFEENDVIKVYAYESGDISKMKIDGIDNTYNGARWTTSEPMVWTDKDKNYDFLAVFPNFSLTGSGFTSTAYTLRDKVEDNDLLVATNTGTNATGVPFEKAGMIDLPFDHIMSKMTVKLIFKSDFIVTPTVKKVVLKAKANATINFITKEVTATGTVTEKELTKVGDDYITISVPQSIAIGQRMIEVYLDEDPTPYGFITTIETVLEAKKHRVFNLTVGADKRIVLNNVTIIDWGQSEDMNGNAQQ